MQDVSGSVCGPGSQVTHSAPSDPTSPPGLPWRGALLPFNRWGGAGGGRSGHGLASSAARMCAHPCYLFPGTVLDHLVGEETLADYLLYTLNRRQLLG